MAKDKFTKTWITENSLTILPQYAHGVLTLRALYYQLVSLGMTNSLQHYKRVVNAMIDARREGIVDYDQFSDRDRAMVGETRWQETLLHEEIEKAKKNIEAWMEYYSKNRWENQPNYVEVFIEKKALEGVFARPCERHRVALGACKGYPSLTFLHEATQRFIEAERAGKRPIILYFGDYDPSGEDIPRSIEDNIRELGCGSIEVRRIALMHDQVIEWNLPPAPTKDTDSRSKNWAGIGQVELDAVRPEKLERLLYDAIAEVFDNDLYDELVAQEEIETEQYREALRYHVGNL